jgi:hypothetical protein
MRFALISHNDGYSIVYRLLSVVPYGILSTKRKEVITARYLYTYFEKLVYSNNQTSEIF